MNPIARNFRRKLVSVEGVTLIEMIVVVSLVAVMLAMATPSFLDWRRNANFRKTSREITSMLREARSTAITRNQMHMVVFKPNSSNFQMLRNNVVVQKVDVPADVAMRSEAAGGSTANVYVQFNANGTATLADLNGVASDGNVSVNQGATQKFLVTITPTGRVSMKKMY